MEHSGPKVFIYPDVTRCGLLATQVVLVEERPQLGLEPLQGLEMPGGLQAEHGGHAEAVAG